MIEGTLNLSGRSAAPWQPPSLVTSAGPPFNATPARRPWLAAPQPYPDRWLRVLAPRPHGHGKS